MAWLELHQSVTTHAKTLELCDQLDLPEYAAVGLLSCLWLWALDNAPDGVLPDAPRRIARAIRWDKDPDDLIAALVESGYLHRTESGLSIHNWHEYAGKLLDRRQSNANRQKEYRERNKNLNNNDTVTDETPLLQHNDNVTDTLQSRNGATDQTRPDQTQPNQTRPDQTDPAEAYSQSVASFREIYPEKPVKQTRQFVEKMLFAFPWWKEHLAIEQQKHSVEFTLSWQTGTLWNWLHGDGTPLCPWDPSPPTPSSAAPPPSRYRHPFEDLTPEEQKRRADALAAKALAETDHFLGIGGTQ